MVSSVFLVTEGIYYESFHPFQVFVFSIVYAFHVRNVSKVAYAETKDWKLTVHNAERHYLYAFNAEWLVRLDANKVDGRNTRVTLLLWREAIRNALLKVRGTEVLGIDVDLTKLHVRTKVVKSSHMVVVLMSDKHAIQLAERNRQHLLAKVRATVKENVLVPYLQ